MSGQPEPSTPPAQDGGLPVSILRVAAPMALIFLGVNLLIITCTLCWRLIVVTYTLDGSSLGVNTATPTVTALDNIALIITLALIGLLLGVPVILRAIQKFI